MVDLSYFEDMQRIQEEGRFMPILDALGDLTDIQVKIAGPDSTVQRAALYEVQAILRNETAPGFDGLPKSTRDDEGYRDLDILRYSAAVLDWKNIEEGGKPYPCNRDNAKSLMQRFPNFFEQVRLYATSRVLFAPEKGEPTKLVKGTAAKAAAPKAAPSRPTRKAKGK